MKLSLGGAQIGSNYGFYNKQNQLSDPVEIQRLLEYCLAEQITHLDTAQAYPDSEKLIAETGLSTSFQITSKIKLPDELKHADQLLNQVEKSLETLKIDKLYGLLLHSDLESIQAKQAILMEFFEMLKTKQLVEKTGASIYTVSEWEQLCKQIDVDVLQLPINILNQSFSDTLPTLKAKQITLQARSVFSQGILLNPPREGTLPFHHPELIHKLEQYFEYLDQQHCAAATAALGYVKQLASIDQIIVGVDNLAQLQALVRHYQIPCELDVRQFDCSHFSEIDPRNWQV